MPTIKIVLQLISLSAGSWILVHILTAFGIFIAIAYPLWWMLSPSSVTCFFCRSRKESGFCPVCRRTVSKSKKNSPNSLFSAIVNGCLILVLSATAAGLVYMESRIISLYTPQAQKTVTISSSDSGEHTVGEIFPLKVEVSGVEVPINTVRSDITFDPKFINVVDISTTDSFADIFIKKEIDNTAGIARIAGGLTNPGFSKEKGTFATFYLKAIQSGATTVTFLPTSVVLANNGRGDNVLKELASISYLIFPENMQTTKPAKQEEKEKVIGTKTQKGTQLTFYDEVPNVLAIETQLPTPTTAEEKVNTTKVNDILKLLANIDNIILSAWKNLKI